MRTCPQLIRLRLCLIWKAAQFCLRDWDLNWLPKLKPWYQDIKTIWHRQVFLFQYCHVNLMAGAKIFQCMHISCTWLLQILNFVIEEIVQIAENPKYIFLSNWELILTSWLKLEHPQEDSGGKFIMIEGRDLSGLQNYSPYWEVQSNKTNNFVDCLNEINFHSRGVLL